MQNLLIGLGVGISLPIAFMLGKKYIPLLAGNAAARALKEGMAKVDSIPDPVEKELVRNIALDVVKWVEYKMPDKGQGKEKFHLAAEKLCALLPFLKGRDADIETIIENSVLAMDNELKKTAFQLP